MTESGKIRKEANESHSRYRAWQRYGLQSSDMTSISQSVADHVSGRTPGSEVVYLRGDSASKNRRWYAVKFGVRWIPVVWCDVTKTTVTTLPESVLSHFSLVLYPPADQPPPPVTDDCHRPGDPVSLKACNKRLKALGLQMRECQEKIRQGTAETLPKLRKSYEKAANELARLKVLRKKFIDAGFH